MKTRKHRLLCLVCGLLSLAFAAGIDAVAEESGCTSLKWSAEGQIGLLSSAELMQQPSGAAIPGGSSIVFHFDWGRLSRSNAS